MNIDVSVIMPAYNAERFLSIAIDSVLRQKFSHSFELLIADDVSSDNTADIISRYQAQYPEIVKATFHTKNLGCSGNSLSIAMQARGKYIAFCDSDDIWIDPLKLEKQFDFLEQNSDYGMVCTHANIIDAKGEVISEASSVYADTKDASALSADIDKIAVMKSHSDVFNSSVMIRRDLYLRMKENCQWFVDNDCFIDSVWAYYCTTYSKVRIFLEPMILYRSLESSDSHTNDSEKRYRLSKRATIIRTRFLLENDFSFDERMDVLSSEYDYVFHEGASAGGRNTRQTKTYRLGEALLSPIKVIRSLVGRHKK